MVVESWFRSLWKPSKRYESNSEKDIGVLAFEAASLMSKLLHLWQSLSEKQIIRLREEIANSSGIKKLVSENDDYIGKLICMEMTENLSNVAKAVARLSQKCNDPLLKNFEVAFNELINSSTDTYSWQFSRKKMDRKAKKLERYVSMSNYLFQEMEMLADLEQILKRMKFNDITDSITLVEYEKKIAWKRQDVKHLKGDSLWSRTYDYTVLLLARSICTIYSRIGHLFGINHVTDFGVKDSSFMDSNDSKFSHSAVLMQSSVYPSENWVPRYSSGSSGKIISASGPVLRTSNAYNFHSGPLQEHSMSKSSRNDGVRFYSGPLGKSTPISGPLGRENKRTFKLWLFRGKAKRKDAHQNANRAATSTPVGTFLMSENSTPIAVSGSNKEPHNDGILDHASMLIGSKNKLLNAPPETLGAAALALHYANVIIFIEKLVATPHMIGSDARDDLYSMLPASIRSSLRAKLKPYASSMASSINDSALAGEWSDAIAVTLEWLAPLAHNMIRWQSERSIEHHGLASRTNVLLVQTLFFANQEKTEAAITELLVGLNYIWRL